MEQILNTSKVSIDFIKFVNPSITLQTAVRSRIVLSSCSMPLTSEETKNFYRSTDGKKRKSTTELDFEKIPIINTKMVVNSNQFNY